LVDDPAELSGDFSIVDHVRDEAYEEETPISLSLPLSVVGERCFFAYPRHSPWTQWIKAPVRPPTFDKLLLTPEAALLRAGPAELVTRDRPCCALEAVF
jgi:hypothetical protein